MPKINDKYEACMLHTNTGNQIKLAKRAIEPIVAILVKLYLFARKYKYKFPKHTILPHTFLKYFVKERNK